MVALPLRVACALAAAVACVGAGGCGDVGPPADGGGASAVAPASASPLTATREASGLPLLAALDAHGATTMASLVRAAGLESRLSRADPLTMVAPDDGAFAAFAPAELARLLGHEELAAAFVLDHSLAGRVAPEALSDGLLTETLYVPAGLREASHRLGWSVRAGALLVEGARVTTVLDTPGATVYVVDRPLPAIPSARARPACASPGERVTILCRWVDTDGAPVVGARCTFGWHFGSWMPHDTAFTDARGVARCTRVVPDTPGDDRIVVTVTTHGRRPSRTVVASFVVR